MKRVLPYLLLLSGCASAQLDTQPVSSPFRISVSAMVTALRTAGVDTSERTASSVSFTMRRTEHCLVFFPVDILASEDLSFDEEQYSDVLHCDAFPDLSDSSTTEPDYGLFRRGIKFYKRYSSSYFLQEVVAYSPSAVDSFMIPEFDSLAMSYRDSLYKRLDPELLVMKVFHRDREFDRIFPAWRNTATFDYDTLMSMYHQAFEEVRGVADSMGMQLMRKNRFTDTERFAQFRPLPFKDAFEICTWINWQTRERMQLALMPARPWDEYELNISIGRNNRTLRYDNLTERFDTISPPESVLQSDSFREQVHGWNIQREDLAIWLIYSGPERKL
ncbi:MAG: hypothetical protein IPL52_08415 [Flavobacteriales bacterium]|nr:hypothetical protein [Flavobacteriales bacterium]